jgi:predicted ribosome quality control (RQC) complex YloA/Tae2 family protein
MKEYKYECKYDNYIYTINVGRNAKDNWDLIDKSKQEDIWFHVDDIPSCHVVLTIDDNKIPHKSVINYCAFLCKSNSKARYIKNISIIYTEIKNIRKSKTIGSVITKHTKIIKL